MAQARETGGRVSARGHISANGLAWDLDVVPIRGASRSMPCLLLVAQDITHQVALVEDLESLLVTTEALLTPTTPATVAEVAGDHARFLVEDVECRVAWITPDQPDRLMVLAASESWARSAEGHTMSVTGQSITELAPVESREELAGGRVTRIRGIPLTIGTDLAEGRPALGVISFRRTGADAFGERERFRMQEFANRVGLCLHRAELLDQATRSVQRLQLAIDITLNLATSPDAKQAISRLLKLALQALDADLGRLDRVERDWLIGEGAYDLLNGPASLPGRRRSVSPAVLRAMLAQRPAVLESDPSVGDDLFPEHSHDLLHAAAVPLVMSGSTVALLSVGRRCGEPFSPSQLDTLEQMHP